MASKIVIKVFYEMPNIKNSTNIVAVCFLILFIYFWKRNFSALTNKVARNWI